MIRRLAVTLVLGSALVAAAAADEPVDFGMVTRIRDEGFGNSKVMETLFQLTDVIGARLTGSPSLKKANEWTRDQLTAWGLQNAHLESWGPFGRGWSFDSAELRMLAPTEAPLVAYPKAWTPGTEGPVRAKAMKVKLETEADLEKIKRKVAGMIMLVADPRELKGPNTPLFTRFTNMELECVTQLQIPSRLRTMTPVT